MKKEKLDSYNLEYKVICLHQIFRPELHFPKEGYGNCCICKYDIKNKYCKGYVPVTISYIEELYNKK